MSTNVKKLMQWYRQILKHDIHDPQIVELVEKEIDVLEDIFQYLDSVLNGSGTVDRSRMKRLLEEESQAEEISRKLEQKFKEDGLEMGGNRGLKYINSLEDLTQGFINYERIQEKRQGQTESGPRAMKKLSTSSANYILTFQQHSKMAKMTDGIYEKSDALVIENAQPHRLQNRPWVNKEIPGEDIENAFQSIMFRNLVQGQKPVYTVDLSLKGQKGPFENGETNETKENIRMLIHEQGGAAAYLSAAVGTMGGTMAFDPGLMSLSFIPMGVAFTMALSANLFEKGIDVDTSKLRLLEFFNPSVMRSAVIAEKLDDYLGPKLAKEKGSKPTIYLNYGLAHQDIKIFLEKPKLRKFIIKLHSAGNFPTMEEKSASLVTEFTFGPNKKHYLETTYQGQHTETYYSVQTIDTGLIN